MTSEAKDYSKMILDFCYEKGIGVKEIVNSSINVIAKLYCIHIDRVVDIEEQAEAIKKNFIDKVHEIEDKIGIIKTQEKKEINNEMKVSRVQNLVDKFVEICESENMLDIIESTIIFFSATHLKYFGDSSIPLETHGENLKHDFIECCKNAKKLTLH